MNEATLNLVFCILGIGFLIVARLIVLSIRIRREPIDDNAEKGDNKNL